MSLRVVVMSVDPHGVVELGTTALPHGSDFSGMKMVAAVQGAFCVDPCRWCAEVALTIVKNTVDVPWYLGTNKGKDDA